MRKLLRSPIVAAVSVLIAVAGLGILAGLVLTRQTGSFAAGVVASNVGMLLGLLLGYRVYLNERPPGR